jgi:hypothetical protein
MQDEDTLKPEPLNESEFRCGFSIARIASPSVLDQIPSNSNSLRMGFIAYHSIATGTFTSVDELAAADFAEQLHLTPPTTKFG